MSVTENRAAFRRYCDEVVTQGHHEIIEEVIDPELVIHCPLPLPPGYEGLKQGLRMERAAFPDHAVTAVDVIAEGDKVVGRCTITGTHEGSDILGMAASGKSFEVEEIMIARFRDGRIVELWSVVDLQAMMQQLGAIAA